jgi:hypothetical protein
VKGWRIGGGLGFDVGYGVDWMGCGLGFD